MAKKILAVILSCLMVFGFSAVTSFAEEEQPTVTVHDISELKAALEAADEETKILVAVGDTISLETVANTEVLVVNYITNAFDGSESYSAGEFKSFNDYNQTNGYAVKGINDMTTHAVDKNNIKVTNKNIDFAADEAVFAGWEVTYVYTESNFNEITLCAVWESTAQTGWAGFYETLVKYIDTIVNYFLQLFKDAYAAFVEWMN